MKLRLRNVFGGLTLTGLAILAHNCQGYDPEPYVRILSDGDNVVKVHKSQMLSRDRTMSLQVDDKTKNGIADLVMYSNKDNGTRSDDSNTKVWIAGELADRFKTNGEKAEKGEDYIHAQDMPKEMQDYATEVLRNPEKVDEFEKYVEGLK